MDVYMSMFSKYRDNGRVHLLRHVAYVEHERLCLGSVGTSINSASEQAEVFCTTKKLRSTEPMVESIMSVHIVIDDLPLCGFTGDPPRNWPHDELAVHPEEAHFATCHYCIGKLHARDEMECQLQPVSAGLRR